MPSYAAVDFPLSQTLIAQDTDLSAYPAGTLRYLTERGLIAADTGGLICSVPFGSYVVNDFVDPADFSIGVLLRLIASGYVVGGVAGSQSVAIGQASSTMTAQAMTHAKRRVLGQSAETDSAQVIAGVRTLLSASFTAADGTSAAVYVPEIGSAGFNQNGVWTIQGNQLDAPPATNEAVVSWTVGVSTYSMQFTFSTISGDPGPCVRLQNNTNYILCQLNSAGTSAIYKRISGAYTALTTPTSISWTNGDIVRVDVTPTTLAVFRNGSQVMSVTDSTLGSQQQIGFRAAPSGCTVRFDDLLVTA